MSPLISVRRELLQEREEIKKKKRVVIDISNTRDGQGMLESDQTLWDDAATQRVVRNYAGNVLGLLGLRFYHEFPKSMVKMSSIGVETGNQGEIRKICSRFN